MIRFILDTDILTLLSQNHDRVLRAVALRPAGDLAITVIRVEEQLTGWYSLIRRAGTPTKQAIAYLSLAESVRQLSRLEILTYTESAIGRFDKLVRLRLNVGSRDLRIAAIALESGCAVVTRNERDFRRVPGLVVENWASETPDE